MGEGGGIVGFRVGLRLGSKSRVVVRGVRVNFRDTVNYL